MPEPRKPRQAIASPSHTTLLVAQDVINVIVLVTGTTSPGNLGTDDYSSSYSLPGEVDANGNPKKQLTYWGEFDPKDTNTSHPGARDPSWYWQDNPKFRNALVALQKEYTNLHIFHVHGWSGDNNKANRTVAGTYLADRLCGAGPERRVRGNDGKYHKGA